MTEPNVPTAGADAAPSLYEQLGGAAVIRTAVDRFYQRVLADPELAPYFADSNVSSVKRHQALLLAGVLGGPGDYDGRTLAEAHAGLGVTGPHYDAVAAYLREVLVELAAPAHIVEAVAETVKSVRDEIVAADAGRSDEGIG